MRILRLTPSLWVDGPKARGSVVECGCSFCRFWFALGCRMESARKDRRTPKAPPISRHGRTSRQRHGVRLFLLPALSPSRPQLSIVLRPTLSSLPLRFSACLRGLCVRIFFEFFISSSSLLLQDGPARPNDVAPHPHL